MKAADVISNVSELLDDYACEPEGKGDMIFERFIAPKAAANARVGGEDARPGPKDPEG